MLRLFPSPCLLGSGLPFGEHLWLQMPRPSPRPESLGGGPGIGLSRAAQVFLLGSQAWEPFSGSPMKCLWVKGPSSCQGPYPFSQLEMLLMFHFFILWHQFECIFLKRGIQGKWHQLSRMVKYCSQTLYFCLLVVKYCGAAQRGCFVFPPWSHAASKGAVCSGVELSRWCPGLSVRLCGSEGGVGGVLSARALWSQRMLSWLICFQE